jgi:hypothetical protein
MPVVRSVDDIEADYDLLSQFGANKKCAITLRNQKKKLHLEKASSGEGYAQYFYLYKQGPGRTNQWKARMTLVNETPLEWSSTALATGGESIQITLGEKAPLFTCSGFVRGNLEGTIRAPALHLKITGKDLWIFFLYFESESRNYSIQCDKDSLEVVHGSTTASAKISTVDGNPPRILASLKSDGNDYDKIKLVLDRAVGKGTLQDSLQQEISVLTNMDDGYGESSWSPVKRDGVEVLWVFSSPGIMAHRGPLKDVLEALGAKVNRSMLADNLGGNEMEDFIIADDPEMLYQLGLVLEYESKSEVNDWTGFELVEQESR